MQIIALANQKGGCGKTATVAALAQAAAFKKKRTLVIDLDPQGNLTYSMGADANKPGAGELFNGTPAEELIQEKGKYLDVIPASWELATVATFDGSARRLQKALNTLKKKYSYIFIDTPPTIGEMQYNAMQAATDLIIPLKADSYSLQSLYQVLATAKMIQNSNKELKIRGIVFTKYDQRSTISKQMRQMISTAAAAQNVPTLGEIRSAVCVIESAALQESLFEYAPKSKPAIDYMNLFDQISR